jgi:cobyric acid synthase
MTDRQIMYDKSNFLRDGIMNNHDRRNLNIRSIMELKIHMRDRITTGRRERENKNLVNRDDHCNTYPNIIELKIHGIMNNPNRRNSIIRIIMELKMHMRDLITTGRHER